MKMRIYRGSISVIAFFWMATVPIPLWESWLATPEGRARMDWIAVHGGFLPWYGLYLTGLMGIFGFWVKRRWHAADCRRGERA